ncbi:hypothetical protein H5410_021633 [Solanum commersonii]|uniref:Uncharacterized protein n=1 Tax=Solanum commersonii TaxID=4109 RepID=A0A9J5ZET5_SOLCO|nr:hypothetical protein H5410_021633 [Solanum commersonii]
MEAFFILLMSLVQFKKKLRHLLYCLCVFLDFSAILGIYIIFGHFWAIRKEVKFSSFIRHDILSHFWAFTHFGEFTSYYAIIEQLQKEVRFCSFIRPDILSHFEAFT